MISSARDGLPSRSNTNGIGVILLGTGVMHPQKGVPAYGNFIPGTFPTHP